MKIKKKIKKLSFVFAIILTIVCLPLGAITAYAAEEDITGQEVIADNVAIDEENNELQNETEAVSQEKTEEETEVFYEEYEIENSAMSAPPLTPIGGVAESNALTVLPDGVYAIENVGNDNYFMTVEGGYDVAGFRIVQQNYSSSTPLTNFSRSSLFKVSRIGNTDQYVIRSMLNNRMSFMTGTDIDANKFSTGYINTNDSSVTTTYTITYSGGNYIIKPYGSTSVLATPNTTISGDTNPASAQLILSTQSAAGNRGKWNFTAYTGNIQYGVSISRTAGMGNGLVKGKTGTIWLKSWSTVIGANTPYISVDSSYSDIVTANWYSDTPRIVVTGEKCRDFEVNMHIRSGSSQTNLHTFTHTYTIIPDIVGKTAFLQNVATQKYAEVDGASTADGATVQQMSLHTGTHMQWVFELAGEGYFTIKSLNSGLYLGVPKHPVTQVKQFATITDYMRWKIVETSAGNYKLVCKASTWRNSVLTVPSAASGDGVDLTTKTPYSEDENYDDEWKILINYGSLQYWNSNKNVIGYWKSTPKIYVENMRPSPYFRFEDGVLIALNQWSNALNMTFEYTTQENADISIYGVNIDDYNELSVNNYHVTLWPFGAVGFTDHTPEVTGYAFYNGNIIEVFRIVSTRIYILYEETNAITGVQTIFTVTHEFGHGLGYMGHSSNESDVMYSYRHYNFNLSSNDVNHISQIYELIN